MIGTALMSVCRDQKQEDTAHLVLCKGPRHQHLQSSPVNPNPRCLVCMVKKLKRKNQISNNGHCCCSNSTAVNKVSMGLCKVNLVFLVIIVSAYVGQCRWSTVCLPPPAYRVPHICSVSLNHGGSVVLQLVALFQS